MPQAYEFGPYRERAAARLDDVTRRYPGTVWDLSIARVYLSAGDITSGVASLQHAFEADRTCARYVSETPAFAPCRTSPQVAAALASAR